MKTFGLWLIVIGYLLLMTPVQAVSSGVQLPSANPLDRLNSSGNDFEWIKYQYQWQPGQSPGEGQPIEEWVNRANAAGKRVLISVAPKNRDVYIPPTEETYQEFGSFLQGLAGMLGSRVEAYEIWNEPNIVEEWTNVGLGEINAGEYVKLLAYGAAGVKAGNPAALTISAGLATNSPNELDFLNEYLNSADLSNVDCLGAHLDIVYNIAPEDDNDQGFQRVRHYLNYGKPVCITELGWNRARAEISRETQAQYIQSAFDLAPSLGDILMMIVWNFGFSPPESYDPDFPNWDIEGLDLDLPPNEEITPPAGGLTPSPTPTTSTGREEQAVYNLNQGVLPKEAILNRPLDDNILSQILGFAGRLLAGLFWGNILNEPKFYGQSESFEQASLPKEIKPEDKGPFINIQGFLGGSTGFYGVSLPREVQSQDIRNSERAFEKAYFPKGISPITGQ